MQCRIHRGSHEIGGSCVELAQDGHRLVLDLGLPLTASMDEDVPLPSIAGLTDPDPDLLGVVVSHGHPDHYGLATRRAPSVPLYCGESTAAILREAAFFSPSGADLRPAAFLCDRTRLQLGPFSVTPYLADHSAFDAYSLLIEAGGRRLFYAGDLRAHGRKHVFEQLVARPPTGVHATLMEGTSLSRDDEHPPVTERALEEQLLAFLTDTPGMALVAYSAQNVDRLVTVYRVSKRAGRLFVMDLYAATIARATQTASIPQADWEGLCVYVPQSQRIAVKRSRQFDRTSAIRTHRIFPEQLADRADNLVMTFRGSMARELATAECLTDAALAWSMWAGYLQQPSSDSLRTWLAEQQIPVTHLHTSGHASTGDLQRLRDALGGRVVPIHTAAPERFADLFADVEPHGDGEWWSV